MEVMIPPHHLDLNFNSARSSPLVSPPTSPKPFGEYYFSAPTSPSHLSQFYRHFDDNMERGGRGGSAVPFKWEEKPGTPKSPAKNRGDFDFAFDVNEDWESASVSAEELFDGGVIKPLKPPPRLQLPSAVTSPRKKPISTKIIQGFSPRHKNKTETDPFAIAAQNAINVGGPPQRGRERDVILPKSSSRRMARSLSPLRDAQYPWELEENTEEAQKTAPSTHFSSTLSILNMKSQKKWRLRDFFLFRSASEGRAADKDPLRKYTTVFRHSGNRTAESSGSRRRAPVSAHELHYTINRAVSEDLKRKTFLPYKQGILGRLAFNPAVHALANGFGFSRK